VNVAILCIGLLGLLVVGLGFAVSVTRGRTDRAIGFSEDPTDTLHKMVRAHGNTAEYAGILAVLMLVAGMQQPATWVLWCMILVTVCRYLLVAGILVGKTLARPHPLRFIGALGTYVGGLALVVAVLMSF